jgi:rare lipoprotein A
MTAMPGSVSSRSKQPVCLIILCAALVGLAGCASQPKPAPAERSAREGAAPGSGRYYLDDGPGERSIADLEKLPDAVPRSEPLHPRANRPYVVFGRQYLPMTQLEPMRERGIATWYGRRYHDRPTAIGERYDMYGMTAAHPRLPLPSFARVTNLRNGRTITVRVNDRGPFLHGRVIDLSYAAAAKLGFANIGSTEVEVELITDFEARTADAFAPPRAAVPVPSAVAAASVVTSAPRSSSPMTGSPVVPAQPASSITTPATAPMASGSAVPTQQLQATATVARQAAIDPRSSAAAAPVDRASPVVQIGAFSSLDNAEAARRGLEPRLRPLGHGLSVVREGRLFRLVAGPFADGDEALAAARQIRSMTGLEAFPRPR